MAALSRFETFLFSAVATVLLVRLFLAATGYPQVGGGGLHVAHVLWGGLLMGVAIVIMLIGAGNRMRVRAAVVGGIGFGLFIDEIGKFLTKDVDYFFKPAIAIIYAVFVAFYLIVREVVERSRLTDARRNALGAMAVADQSLGELDEAHRAAALELLDQVEVEADVAAALRAALRAQPVSTPALESRITRLRDRGLVAFTGILETRRAQKIVIVAFIAGAVLVLLGAVYDLATDNFASSGPEPSELGALASSLAAAAVTMVGVVLLLRSERVRALRMLQVAVLIDLLVTDVFQFATIQLLALVGFGVQIVVFTGIRFALRAEQVEATRTRETSNRQQ